MFPVILVYVVISAVMSENDKIRAGRYILEAVKSHSNAFLMCTSDKYDVKMM